MNRSHITRRIVVATLACAFAVAMAAPAQARPDDRAVHGPGVVAASVSGDPVRPDDRADRTIAPAAQPAAGRPDDRAFRGVGLVPAASPVRPDARADQSLPTIAVEALPRTADGFDWSDAGIGAAGAFGLVLLVAGASVVGLRLRRAVVLS
jgi:hypothetical protein